jgi:LysR family hydrogen peroxide-inducible transcriptional activator
MEIPQLRYFCAVVRTGSFTRAAEEENISQPSLSESIRKLEASVGAPLFTRLGRGVKLTAQGERLLPHAQQVLRQISEARRAIDAAGGKAAGRLAVGVIPTILPYFVAPQLGDFTRAYPHIDLELHEDQTRRLVERLQDGELDLAVLALPLKNPDLVCSELFREPLLLAVSKSHSLSHREAADLSQVRNDPVLLLKEGHCFRDDILGICRKARVLVERRFESDHLGSILALVAGGYGVGIIPRMAAPHAAGCCVLTVSPRGERRIGYARLRKPPTAAARAFTNWMRKLRPPG